MIQGLKTPFNSKTVSIQNAEGLSQCVNSQFYLPLKIRPSCCLEESTAYLLQGWGRVGWNPCFFLLPSTPAALQTPEKG